jgi:hypothetical protein
LKDQEFSIFPNQNPRFKQQPEKAYAPFRAGPSRRTAAARTKNIENNPMQSSRAAAGTGGSDRKFDTSGKSAAQFDHHKIR